MDELRISTIFDVSDILEGVTQAEGAFASLASPLNNLTELASTAAGEMRDFALSLDTIGGSAGAGGSGLELLQGALVGINGELAASTSLLSAWTSQADGQTVSINGQVGAIGELVSTELGLIDLQNELISSDDELAGIEAELTTAMETRAVATGEIVASTSALITADEERVASVEAAAIAEAQQESILIDVATQQTLTAAATNAATASTNAATVNTQKYTVAAGQGATVTAALRQAVVALNNLQITGTATTQQLAAAHQAVAAAAQNAGLAVNVLGNVIQVNTTKVNQNTAALSENAKMLGYLGGRAAAYELGLGSLGFGFGILGRSITSVNAVLVAAFPVIGLILLAEVVSGLHDKFLQMESTLRKANVAFDDLGTQGLRNVENIELQTLKLDDEIARFEGRPAVNKLAEAIIESSQEVDKLTDSFERSIEKELELLETGKVGLFRAALTGHEETTEFKDKADPRLKTLNVLVAAQSQANVQLQLAQDNYTSAKDAAAQKAAEIDLATAQKAKSNADNEVKTYTEKSLGILTSEQGLTKGQLKELNSRYDAAARNLVAVKSFNELIIASADEAKKVLQGTLQTNILPTPKELEKLPFEQQKIAMVKALEEMRAEAISAFAEINAQESGTIIPIEAHILALKREQKVDEDRQKQAIANMEDAARATALTNSEAADKISDKQGQQAVQIAKENAQSLLREEQAGLELQVASHVRGGESKAQADLTYSATKRFLIGEETKDQLKEENAQYAAHRASLERRKQTDALKKPGSEQDTAIFEADRELELAYTAHQAAMVRIARDGASKLTIERSKELDDEAKIATDEKRMLDETNKAFEEAMKKREAALKTSSNRADTLQVRGENEELRGIQEQIKGYERLFQEHDIGSNQERKNLQASIALLEQKTAAAKRAVEATQGDIGRTAATQKTQTPGSQEFTNSAEKLQDLDKDLEQQTSLWRRYQQLLESTNQAFSKLDITTKGFFNDLMNRELTAGVSWKSFTDQFQMSWQKALVAVNNDFSNSVGQWILHGGSFVRAMQNMGAELVANLAKDFVKMGLVMLETWLKATLQHLIHQHAQTAATVAAQTAQTAAVTAAQTAQTAAIVGAKGAQAAASAASVAAAVASDVVLAESKAGAAAALAFFDTMQGVPWPANLAAAPIAGDIALGQGQAYVAAAGAEKGAVLASDQPIFAHKNEMILPAHISKGLQGMISGGNLSTNNNSSSQSTQQNRISFQNTQNISGGFDPVKHTDEMFKSLQGKLRRRGINL